MKTSSEAEILAAELRSLGDAFINLADRVQRAIATVNTETGKLESALRDRAEFWRTNTDDPHGIATAVYVALSEVGQALANARAQEILKSRERVYNPLPK